MTEEIRSKIVWIDQGMGHGHVELKTFEGENELHSMHISCTEEIESIKKETDRYLETLKELDNGN